MEKALTGLKLEDFTKTRNDPIRTLAQTSIDRLKPGQAVVRS
jgi:hypothetical protein